MALKRLTIWAIIATGICSVNTQLLTVREFLSQFQGNEITISIALFCWLLMTGLGSLAAKAFKRSTAGVFAFLSLVIAFWPLVQMVAIRGLREILFAHGTAPGFYSIFFYILFTISPYCLLIGFILPYSLEFLRSHRYDFTTGELYLFDSIGDVTGGLLFSFLFVYWVKPFRTIAMTAILLVLFSFFMLYKTRRFFLFFSGLLLAAIFYAIVWNGSYEVHTLSGQYGDIVRYLESPYGRIVVTQEGSQHTIWESGTPLYSGSDVIRAEEKVHYPLCQLNKVRNVLLISGGLGRTLNEISKYHPRRVDYVELDPFLVDAALDLGVLKPGPIAHIQNTDGRRYMALEEREYDAILVDLPDPDTFQLNRFFTSEFFSLAKKRLSREGILCFGLEYGANYLSEIRKKKLSTVYNTARLHFENILVLPGQEAYFLCRNGPLTADIPQKLAARSIHTSYIEGFFYGNVTQERIENLQSGLHALRWVNKDFQPKLMRVVFQEWFMKYGRSPKYFLWALGFLCVVYLRFMKRQEYLLFTTGLVNMGAEMLVVFTFQVIYGYIYLKIGAVVTAFLFGLFPGALAGRAAPKEGIGRILLSDMAIMVLLMFFFLGIALFKARLHPTAFLAYGFVFSFLCGYQFPVAAALIGEEKGPAPRCLAADLTGASLGTILVGMVWIPFFGIPSAVILLILVKISSSLLFISAHWRKA